MNIATEPRLSIIDGLKVLAAGAVIGWGLCMTYWPHALVMP